MNRSLEHQFDVATDKLNPSFALQFSENSELHVDSADFWIRTDHGDEPFSQARIRLTEIDELISG
jgi:hypothetical protein